MVDHRQARLLVRAAADGYIDFSQANPWDRRWYIRRNLLLSAAENAWAADFLKCRLSKHLAMLQSPHVTENAALTYNRDKANTVLDMLFALATGEDATHKSEKVDAVAQARREWVRAYGDPSTPTVAKSIDAVVEQLRRQRLTARKAETRHERVTA